ncbi:MAG: glycine cleavage T C-terminal barrel domain-containing protein [Terriglobales bacterium]
MTASALLEMMTSTSAHLENYSGTQTAADFGNVRAEFNALISSCGIYDLGWRAKIALTGGDRTRWLNGMVTNNVRDLPVGHGLYAFLLNPQGRIQGDLYAFNRSNSLLLDMDRLQVEKILAIFDHYIIMDDVEVSDQSATLTAIGIAGPASGAILQTAGFDLPELKPLQFADVSWRGKPVTFVRSDKQTGESYELWITPENAAEVWETLVRAGAVPVGTTAFDLFEIAAGIPRYGCDIREKDLPQETEQERALNFSKGCYIGQEIVERIRSRGAVHRKFTGFAVHGSIPTPGTRMQIEGKDVGEVTSSASLPIEDRDYPVARGYLRREFAVPGKELVAGETKFIVVNLAFPEIFKK